MKTFSFQTDRTHFASMSAQTFEQALENEREVEMQKRQREQKSAKGYAEELNPIVIDFAKLVAAIFAIFASFTGQTSISPKIVPQSHTASAISSHLNAAAPAETNVVAASTAATVAVEAVSHKPLVPHASETVSVATLEDTSYIATVIALGNDRNEETLRNRAQLLDFLTKNQKYVAELDNPNFLQEFGSSIGPTTNRGLAIVVGQMQARGVTTLRALLMQLQPVPVDILALEATRTPGLDADGVDAFMYRLQTAPEFANYRAALGGQSSMYEVAKFAGYSDQQILELERATGAQLSTYAYSQQDKDFLTRNIFHEARRTTEPYIGKVLVGLVVLNRTDDPRWPNTVKDVVLEKNQFSWVHQLKQRSSGMLPMERSPDRRLIPVMEILANDAIRLKEQLNALEHYGLKTNMSKYNESYYYARREVKRSWMKNCVTISDGDNVGAHKYMNDCRSNTDLASRISVEILGQFARTTAKTAASPEAADQVLAENSDRRQTLETTKLIIIASVLKRRI